MWCLKTRTQATLIATLLATVTWAQNDANTHTLFDFSAGEANTEWRVNLWGKNPDGSKGKGTIEGVKAPGGDGFIQFTTENSGGCCFISPDVSPDTWQGETFAAVEIRYRGDNTARSMTLYLDGLAADGKTPARSLHPLPFHGTSWKTLILKPTPEARGKPTVDLARLKTVYFKASGDQQLKVARIRLVSAEILAQMEAAKSPEQRAWEAAVKPSLLRLPGFAYVENDPELPNVLIMGDSISIHYTHFVRDLLAGKANLHRIPANGGPTERGLAHMKTWLGTRQWDVIYFNFGLHDSKYTGWDRATGKRYSTPEKYAENLDQLVTRLKATGAHLIWATTTPIPEGAKTHDVGDSVQYNAAADPVIRKHGLQVSDLFNHVQPDLATHQIPKNIHFSPAGSAFLAKKVAADILTALKERDQ